MSSGSVNSDTCDELRKAMKYVETFEKTLNKFSEKLISLENSESGVERSLAAYTLFLKYLGNVVSFGKRALISVTTRDDGSDKSCLLVSTVLRLLGVAYLNLQMYDESLSYLNRAETNLSQLDQTDFLLDTALDIQIDFCKLKSAMGRNQDVIVHAKKALEIKEKMMEEGCFELGKANQTVSQAYLKVLLEVEIDLKGAIPYCLKAQEIYTKCLGPDSVEVAEVMRSLAIIYYKSGEIEKALAQNRLAASAFRKTAPRSHDLWTTETDSANMLFTMGRFDEAIDILKGLFQHTDIKEKGRAILTLSMAQGMLKKKGMEPMLVATAFAEMSRMYEMINDLDTAIFLAKGVLAVPELPHKLFQEHSLRIFLLMILSGKYKEEILYMEGVVKKLNEYLGPHHSTVLKLSHALSLAYAGLGRFHQALGIEEKVAKGLKGLAPSELGFMHDVTQHLNKMRERVAESPTGATSQSKDEGGLSVKISDDGKVLK